jgi:hypothetical protein
MMDADNVVQLPVVTDPATAFLERAIESGNIEVIERAVALYERREDRAALVAYNKAMAAAKAEIPAIIKDRIAEYDHASGRGRTKYAYVELATICKAVDPALSKYGLHFRWRTVTPASEPIQVTCIIFHELGHSEENSASGMPDASGAKNSIQQVQSTITYLQRSTLCSALGIAAGRDDDAQAAGAKSKVVENPPISAADMQAILARTANLQIDMGTFYQMTAKHVGWPIEDVSELKASHVKWVNDNLDMYERNQKRLAAEAVKKAQK